MVFTGTATVTAWTLDSNGNLLRQDLNVPAYTGEYSQTMDRTTTDGQYGTLTFTVNFSGTSVDGSAFGFKEELHATVPPSPVQSVKFFEVASCS